jgi:hypothetical protein
MIWGAIATQMAVWTDCTVTNIIINYQKTILANDIGRIRVPICT